MKSPTKEQIEEAALFIDSDPSMGKLVHRSYAKTILAAYCSALARAELAERQYRELSGHRYGDIESIASMEARHARERKELEA